MKDRYMVTQNPEYDLSRQDGQFGEVVTITANSYKEAALLAVKENPSVFPTPEQGSIFAFNFDAAIRGEFCQELYFTTQAKL